MNIIQVQLTDVYLKKAKELDDIFYDDKALIFEWYKKRYNENHNALHFNPKMFLKKSKYNYIVSALILEEYRKKGYGSKILKKLFFSTKGKFCALSIIKEVFYLARKYMKHKIDDDINVFILNNRCI